ncbi:MAG: YIP1 family protein [Tannerella sp.]|jgi:TM2 domain-containing membrane protein YozV|nr:YIP1 family protein [Tannerella sp.]
MDIINRVKNILVSPKKEWAAIEGENAPHTKLFTAYVLPLSLIPALTAFVGYGLIGYSVLGVHVHSIGWGIRQAVSQWITMAGGVYITAFVIHFLSGHFGARKDFDKAFSLVAYAYTPTFAGGIFYLLPSLSWLASLASLYGLYLLYTGMQPVMQTPTDKNTGYFVASLIATVAVAAVLSAVLAAVLLRSYMGGW